LALTVLGSLALLVLGRQALNARPLPTPDTATAALERTRQWDLDPERRREASLLLTARAAAAPARQRQLLQGQGWGRDPLAAVALKLDALADGKLGQPLLATARWRELLSRFPADPASADALYELGRNDPALRAQLWRRFPAHPAALAAAAEAGPGPAQRRAGALHLARWGARWPGAEGLLRQTCQLKAPPLSAAERRVLARGLGELGDGAAAAACLAGAPSDAATELVIGRALLKGTAAQNQAGEARLLALASRWPAAPEALEAARLLSGNDSPTTLARLARLPQALQQSAPVAARRAATSGRGWQQVLGRWPTDPASWELQWELAREALLKRRWAAAAVLLSALEPQQLPSPLAARQLFWLGYAQQELGEQEAARRSWSQLLERNPWGYYGWRARVRLGLDAPLALRSNGSSEDTMPPAPPWQPLRSGNGNLNRLWRLDQPLESWERWRTARRNQPPQQPADLTVEGRLRQGVGDDWTSLGQLELASLRWVGASCRASLPLEQALHPLRFGAIFGAAATAERLDPALLLGVAKQESRFTPGVRSPVGAVGLLQLMPATAAELAGAPVSDEQLRQPEVNVPLGARYLNQRLRQWSGNPFLTAASYNAGQGSVGSWLEEPADPSLSLSREPELWVEAIPFPETRLYVKKVLGNVWSYQALAQQQGC
jgi:soluble lytic murein transglycosylase